MLFEESVYCVGLLMMITTCICKVKLILLMVKLYLQLIYMVTIGYIFVRKFLLESIHNVVAVYKKFNVSNNSIVKSLNSTKKVLNAKKSSKKTKYL